MLKFFRSAFVSLRKRIKIELNPFVLIFLVHGPGETIVTARYQLRPGLDRMLAQLFLQQFVRDATAPKLVGFRLIFRPGRFLAAELNRRVGFKIHRLVKQLLHLGHALVHALRVEIVNFVGRFQIAEKNVIAKRVTIFGTERVNILLCKKKMTVVEQLQISLEEFSRHFIVERLMRVMAFLQQPTDRDADLFGIRLRLKRVGCGGTKENEGGNRQP